jgi:hypothetical protein
LRFGAISQAVSSLINNVAPFDRPCALQRRKTSLGSDTSDAPLSRIKSNLILPLISTGTKNVPPPLTFSGTVTCDDFGLGCDNFGVGNAATL